MYEPRQKVGTVEDRAVTCGRHEERLLALERYQVRQNGTVTRIEQKLDDLIAWFMRASVGFITVLAVAFFSWVLKG